MEVRNPEMFLRVLLHIKKSGSVNFVQRKLAKGDANGETWDLLFDVLISGEESCKMVSLSSGCRGCHVMMRMHLVRMVMMSRRLVVGLDLMQREELVVDKGFIRRRHLDDSSWLLLTTTAARRFIARSESGERIVREIGPSGRQGHRSSSSTLNRSES